jgi:hypothetical protein
MIVWRRVFRRFKIRKFLCQLIRFMDQDRQALWTDVILVPLEFQMNERAVHVGRAAVQAVEIGHEHPRIFGDLQHGIAKHVDLLWHVWWCVHDNETPIRSSADRELELGLRRHLDLIRSAAGTAHEQAAVRIAEFYLKDIGVAA